MGKTALSAWTEATAALLGDIRARKQRIKHQYADLKAEWQMIEAEETALSAAVEVHNARVRRFPELVAVPTRIAAPKVPEIRESILRAVPERRKRDNSDSVSALAMKYAREHGGLLLTPEFVEWLIERGRFSNRKKASGQVGPTMVKLLHRDFTREARATYRLVGWVEPVEASA